MRRARRPLAVLLTLGTAFTLTPMAGAQEPVKPEFSFTGSSFPAGGVFTARIKEGTCPGGLVSLTSPGIASIDLSSLIGRVVTAPGRYTATLKCKDTTEAGTLDFTVEKPPPPRNDPFLDKAEYAPGETIRINLVDGYKCWVLATSEGFTAPVDLNVAPSGFGAVGETKAIATPGTYTATIPCPRGAVINQFTIRAAPVAPPPPGTPKPKPPIVKPKGAADTGGGATA